MNDNTIEQILRSVNIVDIIRSYIPLKRSGSNYKARCPFHEEKTASFNVSETKQIYKCFGCQKAGNAITFIRDYEKITYREAMQKLADKVGISIQNTEYKDKNNSKRDLIYTVYELANDFYVNNFKKYGAKVKRYLEKRDIPLELAEEFSIGYSLDSYNGLKSYLNRNHISKDIFPQTGLFRTTENNELFDLFYDRMMFPIHNTAGKVVAFGGRTMNEEDKQYKYVNSPTTDIYTKGRELYGLHITRFEISKLKFAFISEGYLDFLRLYQRGFKNAVASLGTALTKEQISLLKRYTQNFYLLYDGDNAGIKAAIKAASLIIQHGASPKIVLLPDGHDPDSYLLKHSNEDFKKLVDNAQSLVKFAMDHVDVFDGQRETIQALLDVSVEIEDQINKELFIKDIAETFQIAEKNLRKSLRNSPIQHINVTKAQTMSYKYEEERKILILLIKNPNLRKKVAENLDSHYFISDGLRKIYNFLIKNEDIGVIDNISMLIEKANNFAEDNIEIEEITHLFFDDDFLDNIDDLIRQVKLRKYQEELQTLNQEIAKDSENTELLERKIFVKKEIAKLSKNVVRKTIFT